jgi:hypothetical protein
MRELIQAKIWVIGILVFTCLVLLFISFHFALNYYTLKYEKSDQKQMLEEALGGDCKIERVEVWMKASK